MSIESLRKAVRSSEIRKAFGPEAMQLLENVAQAEIAHGENIALLRDALGEHTLHQMRLSRSFWARLAWLVTGR